jgi:hypothetical protein
MDRFRSILDFSHLHDLGFVGPNFMWCNLREDGDIIKERLD